VGANLCRAVPLVGDTMAHLMLGGEEYSSRTLPRLYVLHAAILPAFVVLLMFIHFTLMRLQGITELKFEDEPKEAPKHFDFFPDHIYTELIVGLVLMIVLTALATIRPAELGPAADPLDMPHVIKPEWFFFATFRWLKLMPLLAAVLSMMVMVGAMIAWPWIDAGLRRITKRDDASVWVGVIVVLAIVGLTVWEALATH
jgi:quinol-cytochrome oxidoreductase complex cytochrome b subunit